MQTWAADSVAMTPAYCSYNNSSSNMTTYGAMYNWYAVDAGNLCPTDWHVPTDADFNTLELYLGLSIADINLYGWRGTDQGAQMKNTTGWLQEKMEPIQADFQPCPEVIVTILMVLFRPLVDGLIGGATDELNATRAWYRRLDGTESGVYRGAVNKPAGKYVRCVKN